MNDATSTAVEDRNDVRPMHYHVKGLVGALFVALAVKGGLIMGGLSFPGRPLALMLALCVAAGASERLVPSLVTAFERFAATHETHRP